MPLRCLFGPVDPGFEASFLSELRTSGSVRTFGHAGADVSVAPDDAWGDVASRFPDGWTPDFVALWLPYASVPAALWQAPVPIVGLAADWSLNWHAYRQLLPLCDMVLTDAPGVAALARSGLATSVRPAVLYGLGSEWFPEPDDLPERDLDAAFVGNLNPAVQGDRLPQIAALAKLHSRHRVRIATGVRGADYRALMRRTKVAFNRSARGECNQRALEAAAAGAALVQEAGNAETFALLEPGTACVAYKHDDLVAVVGDLLSDEPRRRQIAAAASARLPELTFPALWREAVAEHVAPLVAEWSGRERTAPPLSGRVWARLGHAGVDHNPALERDLAAAGDLRTLGLLAPGAVGLPLLGRAAAVEPNDPTLALLLAAAFSAEGDGGAAAAHARRGLMLLAKEDPGSVPNWLDRPPCGPGYSRLRAEWERTAAQHPGEPLREANAKRGLLRWKLHFTLATLTGDLAHYHEAALARPDLPESRTALGCALARAGRPADAVPHLRAAHAADPFDPDTARALYQCLADLGHEAGMRAFAKERRALHAVAPGIVAWEPWLSGPAATGRELVSIVVPCRDQVHCTRLCLESVLLHTRSPYEIVVVDNGSTDGTAEYLREVATRPGPERVAVVPGEPNLSFAAAVNRGLAAARGEFLVLLNNDAVVAPDWLDGLLAHAVADWPKVGLVGPSSNGAPAPQFVPAAYSDEDLSGLDAFAAAHRATHRGQWLDFPRATGFCLLVRREVLDRVGPLDEGYATGFFEDDDLCAAARKAGYAVRIARDVYVHHYGGRTFRALGLDTAELLAANFARFRAKWGEAEAAPYRSPALAAGPKRPAKVCLTAIVRDEEHNLPACLESVRDLVDAIVVVDTGSKDRTREIAREFGATVVEFPWIDDFSAARNEALLHATGDFAFWMDADDRLDAANRAKLKEVFAALDVRDPAGYVLKCRCVSSGPGNPATLVDHVRIFPLRPEVRWKYRVHEQILPGLRAAGFPVRWADAVIDHVGYTDPAVRARKVVRDTRILERELAEHPDDPFALFNLGSILREQGDVERAEPLLARSLALSHPSDSIVRKLYALIAQCRWQAGRRREALESAIGGLGLYPDDAELLYLAGSFHEANGNPAAAEASLRRLVEGSESAHFASVDASLRGAKGRARLGWSLHKLGRAAEAEVEWRRAVADDPHQASALEGLGELAIAAGSDVEPFAAPLDGVDPVAAIVLRARSRMACGEFAEARIALDAAIALHPEVLRLRLVRSHVLLREGTDPAAAEAELREILRREPGHAEASHNLKVLLRERGVAT